MFVPQGKPPRNSKSSKAVTTTTDAQRSNMIEHQIQSLGDGAFPRGVSQRSLLILELESQCSGKLGLREAGKDFELGEAGTVFELGEAGTDFELDEVE